jgi:hypothetical protein
MSAATLTPLVIPKLRVNPELVARARNRLLRVDAEELKDTRWRTRLHALLADLHIRFRIEVVRGMDKQPVTTPNGRVYRAYVARYPAEQGILDDLVTLYQASAIDKSFEADLETPFYQFRYVG